LSNTKIIRSTRLCYAYSLSFKIYFSIERKLTLLGKVESALRKRGDDFERNEKEEEEEELLERGEEEINKEEDGEVDPPEETAEQVNQALEEALEKEELEEAEQEEMIPNWSPEEGRQYNGQMKKDNKTKNAI
jgi:hypothetical protein